MKRRFIVASLAVVAMSATLQASVTLTSFTGSPNVRGTATFAVNAASSARELWCAWGDSDKGTSFAVWPNNERVCTVPANATTVTSPLPWAARKGAVARFFLFPAGGTYPHYLPRHVRRAGDRHGHRARPHAQNLGGV